MWWGSVTLSGNLGSQKKAGLQEMVPRHGSIYDRLDKARAQRMKSLSPQVAANTAPEPRPQTKSNANTKSHLLPTIKSQEDFDPIEETGLPRVAKLGLGVLAFSIMAGFTLLDWGAGEPQTNVTAPAELRPTAAQTILPGTDAPARSEPAEVMDSTAAESLPVIPSPPSGSVVVEVQQEAAPLIAPNSSTLNGAQDP